MTEADFRAEAKRLHPDVGGSAEAFVALVERYRKFKLDNQTCARPGCEKRVRHRRRRDGKVVVVREFCSKICQIHNMKYGARSLLDYGV